MWRSLGGTVGGTELWEVMVVNLLDADYFPREDILSFVVDTLAPLEESVTVDAKVNAIYSEFLTGRLQEHAQFYCNG